MLGGDVLIMKGVGLVTHNSNFGHKTPYQQSVVRPVDHRFGP